jgi:hypothetical protein
MNAAACETRKKNSPLNTSGAAMMFDCQPRLEQDHFFPPVDDYKRRFHSAHPREAHTHTYIFCSLRVFLCVLSYNTRDRSYRSAARPRTGARARRSLALTRLTPWG